MTTTTHHHHNHNNNNNTSSPIRKTYPFAAIVGSEDLKTCLIVCAIDPSIGGVLIRGDKGTAKSTAARGLAELLPEIDVGYDPNSDRYDPCNRRAVVVVPSSAMKHHHHHDPDDDDNDNDEEEKKEIEQFPLDRGDTRSNWDDDFGVGHGFTETRWIPTPFVEFPIGATEDRVLGSIDFGATLHRINNHNNNNTNTTTPSQVFSPGLLAAAHRGLLYVDEVNLLPAHLVDVVLDAAAAGVHVVQRDGLSVEHPARFVLLGTMNPEEGPLRPQLLDRFGLCVDVWGNCSDAGVRVEVVRRRMAFEREGPEEFRRKYANQEEQLKRRIREARALLWSGTVVLSDELLTLIAQLCCRVGVKSLRADLALYKTATALAAYEGRRLVTVEDVRRSAGWVLAHRRPTSRNSGTAAEDETNNNDDDVWDQLVNELANNAPTPSQGDDGDDRTEKHDNNDDDDDRNNDPSGQNNCPEDDSSTTTTKEDEQQPQEQNLRGSKSKEEPSSLPNHDDDNDDHDDQTQTFAASPPKQIKRLQLGRGGQQPKPPGVGSNTDTGSNNRRRIGSTNTNDHITANHRRGRHVRSVPTSERPVDLDVRATLQAAVMGTSSSKLVVTRRDIRTKIRQTPRETTLLFLVDASGSMSARKRMESVKGAVLSLLEDVDSSSIGSSMVGVISFRGSRAELLLEPTRSVEAATQQLRRLPTGGRTPLAHALVMARETVERLRRQAPERDVWLLVLSDGKANVPLLVLEKESGSSGGGNDSTTNSSSNNNNAWTHTERAARELSALAVPTLMIDTDEGHVRVGRGEELADLLQSDYLPLDELTADGLVHTIRRAMMTG